MLTVARHLHVLLTLADHHLGHLELVEVRLNKTLTEICTHVHNLFVTGSGRVTFSNKKSYMRAVQAAFIEIKTPKFTKKVCDLRIFPNDVAVVDHFYTVLGSTLEQTY